MSSILKKLMIFSIPFNGVFTAGFIEIGYFLFCVLCIVNLKEIRTKKLTILILISFALLCFFPAVLDYTKINDSSLIHTIRYLFFAFCIIFMYFLSPNTLSEKYQKNVQLIFYINSLIITFDFVDRNFLNLGLLDVLPRWEVQDYDATYFLIERARGFSVESSHAFFTNLMLFILIKPARGNINGVLLLTTLVATISTFGLIAIFLIMAVEFCVRFYRLRVSSLIILPLVILPISFSIPYILSKIRTTSGIDRLDKIETSVSWFMAQDFITVLFGNGPGFFYSNQGYIPLNFFVNVMLDYGLTGLFFSLVAFIWVAWRIKTVQNLQIFISLATFLLLNSNFWFFINVFAISQIIQQRNKMMNK